MLSVADLTGMRETVDSSLPDTCTVVNDTLVSDGAGGQTIGSSTSTTYACRIAPRLATGTGQLKDAEMDTAGRLVIQAPWLLTLPYAAVVSATSRIRDQHGRAFEVFAVLARRSDELSTLVLSRLINEGAG
jgi:hypothetical protein